MSVTLMALYRRPDDADAFLSHYQGIHLPLVRKIPHLVDATARTVTGSPMSDAPYFLIAEMRFADRPHFDEAMASRENRAAGKDLMGFAKGLVTLLVVEG